MTGSPHPDPIRESRIAGLACVFVIRTGVEESIDFLKY